MCVEVGIQTYKPVRFVLLI